MKLCIATNGDYLKRNKRFDLKYIFITLARPLYIYRVRQLNYSTYKIFSHI